MTELTPSLRTTTAGRFAATSQLQLNQVDCRTSFIGFHLWSVFYRITIEFIFYSYLAQAQGPPYFHAFIIFAGIVAALNVAMDSFEEKSYYERLRSALYSASDDRVSRKNTNLYRVIFFTGSP